jgi:hypothetical protein
LVLLIQSRFKLVNNACIGYKLIDLILLNNLIGHILFSDKQGISYAFYNICNFSEINRKLEKKIYTEGQLATAADRWARVPRRPGRVQATSATQDWPDLAVDPATPAAGLGSPAGGARRWLGKDGKQG